MDPSLLQGTMTTARYARFGPFHIDQQRQQVFRNGTELRWQGKVCEALIVLLQKQGELVTREELKRGLWSTGTHVNYDTNLNTTVNKLRRGLAESMGKVPYIETIPRKGYRFTATVEFSDVPFAEIMAANPAASGTIDTDREQEAPERKVFRSGKSLTVIIVTLLLAGMLLGATAATFWISHAAPQVRRTTS